MLISDICLKPFLRFYTFSHLLYYTMHHVVIDRWRQSAKILRFNIKRQNESFRDTRSKEKSVRHCQVLRYFTDTSLSMSDRWQQEELTKKWKENANPDRKRDRGGKSQEVDVALYRWFNQAQEKGLPVNRHLLYEKAEKLAKAMNMPNFEATNGWIQRWKEQNNKTLLDFFSYVGQQLH